MFATYQRLGRGYYVRLIHARRIGGKQRPEHLGLLGFVAEPISVSERIRFWHQLDARFRAIAACHPGRISPAEEAKVRAKIALRIPRLSAEDERRLRGIEIIQRALDQGAGGEAAIEAAALRLLELARAKRPNRQAEASA